METLIKKDQHEIRFSLGKWGKELSNTMGKRTAGHLALPDARPDGTVDFATEVSGHSGGDLKGGVGSNSTGAGLALIRQWEDLLCHSEVEGWEQGIWKTEGPLK